MDTQADISTMDVDFTPLVGLVAIRPPTQDMEASAGTSASRDKDGSEFQREQQRVLQYLREHLLKGDADAVRDRIQELLFDDEYHRLIQRVEQTVPVMAVREMLEEGELGQMSKTLLPDSRPKLELALRLQFEVVRVIVASMPSAAERPRKRRLFARRKTHVEARERLSFVFDPSIPSALKQAFLAGWIAPMCSLGLVAADEDTSEALSAALVDQWIESLQAQLAFALATHVLHELPYELLPAEKRYELADVLGRHYEGIGRTLQRMGDLQRREASK